MNSPGPDNTPREYPNGSDFARQWENPRPDPTPQVDPYPDGIPPIRAGAVRRFIASDRFRQAIRLALKMVEARWRRASKKP